MTDEQTIAELRAEVKDLRALVCDLADGEECWFDHHGGCQGHGYLSLEPGEECPGGKANRLEARWAAEQLLPSPPDVARANCRGRSGVMAYQETLIPGDIGYLCNDCGQPLLGGLFGMGSCSCQPKP